MNYNFTGRLSYSCNLTALDYCYELDMIDKMRKRQVLNEQLTVAMC